MLLLRSKLKKILLVLVDFLLLLLGYGIGFVLYDVPAFWTNVLQKEHLLFLLLAGLLYGIFFVLFDLYTILLSRLCFEDTFKCVFANFFAAALMLLLNLLFGRWLSIGLPHTVAMSIGLVLFLGSIAVRALPRTVAMLEAFRFARKVRGLGNKDKRVLIYGAGNAGVTLMNNLLQNPQKGYCLTAFFDNDPMKRNCRINHYKIYGPPSSLQDVVRKLGIDTILIAVPSASEEQRANIILRCKQTECEIKTLPALYDLIVDEEVSFKKLRDVSISDILERQENRLDLEKISAYIKGERILVTGAGGSIGSEICRQLLKFAPERLILFDIYENNIYDLVNDLKREFGAELPLETYIGSVRDYERLRFVFEREKPGLVFHAAAHKHVPLMEESPGEAIKNNVFGTYNVVRVSDECGVRNFVLISTDKAVNPTNVMGATKRLAEMVVQAYAKRSRTKFAAVRFGNVLGSNGSVVPLFKKQIAEMGPVTVTDPEVTRFFMTIPEAARLVIQAGAIAAGGEIFILDMGKPVKIADLARNMIRLSGYTPDVDIKIEYVGLRPGEKLYEELLQKAEETTQSSHDGIFIAQPYPIEWADVQAMLEEFGRILQKNNDEEVVECLRRYVPTYHPERNRQKKCYS